MTLVLTRPLVNGLFNANVPNTLELSLNLNGVLVGSWLFCTQNFLSLVGFMESASNEHSISVH